MITNAKKIKVKSDYFYNEVYGNFDYEDYKDCENISGGVTINFGENENIDLIRKTQEQFHDVLVNLYSIFNNSKDCLPVNRRILKNTILSIENYLDKQLKKEVKNCYFK